jgi:peroxiredoxin
MSLNGKKVSLGDPVPWFSAKDLLGQGVDLHVAAGRWIVLAFLGDITSPVAQQKLALIAAQTAGMSNDHLVVYAVLSTPPANITEVLAFNSPVLKFIGDYDGALSSYYGVNKTIALDPMLRAIADIAWDDAGGHDATLEGLLKSLPSVDNAAGVPLTAPALIVPRVFDFPLCELLIGLYDKIGGTDSGFLYDEGGKTTTLIDHNRKRRSDMVIALPELRARIRERIVTRLVPAIKLYFQYEATRMDRYMVSRYDAETGGHFFRHRDNLNAAAEHRRFACTINLNGGYEGGDLIFPEFGRRTYRAPVGGAIVFSCGALHEVTTVTKGNRYAFIPFLYGEEDAKKRLANNARLKEGEAHYTGDTDALYPESV